MRGSAQNQIYAVYKIAKNTDHSLCASGFAVCFRKNTNENTYCDQNQRIRDQLRFYLNRCKDGCNASNKQDIKNTGADGVSERNSGLALFGGDNRGGQLRE